MSWPEAIRLALPAAAPVMVAYLSIGIPAGVMASMVGASPMLSFLVSVTYYSGAGQFMVPKLLLAGQPLITIAMTTSFTNMRQILYSAAFAPYCAHVGKGLSLLFSATVTDESFGVNLDRFERDEAWDVRAATATNLCCMLSWACANVFGCALGPIINLPTALMSFTMTSIFICLLVTQRMNATSAVVILTTMGVVLVLKLVGLGGIAVFVGALCGIVAGLVLDGKMADGSIGGDRKEGAR